MAASCLILKSQAEVSVPLSRSPLSRAHLRRKASPLTCDITIYMIFGVLFLFTTCAAISLALQDFTFAWQ